MPNPQDAKMKRLEIENDLHHRAERLGLDRRAIRDAVNRIIHDGGEVTSAGVRMPAETIDEYIAGRLRETAPHFFVPAAPSEQPAPAAKTDATARLALANGDAPARL